MSLHDKKSLLLTTATTKGHTESRYHQHSVHGGPLLAASLVISVSFHAAGRSDPQISVTPQEGNPLPRRCSNPPSHSSSPQTQAKHGSQSANTENPGQGGKPPRSPHGQGALLRGQKQTWEGQPGASSGSQGSVTPTSSQNHIGPVR